MYLFASVAFAMKVTALHLWSIFTPKSGANAKKREGRMHFGVAQRFAALIAGVRQMSLKLSAKAAAGLPRRVKGIRICGAGWSRNVGGGSCYVPSAARSFAFGELARIEALAALWRGMVSERGGVRAMYRAPCVHLLSGNWCTSRRLCFASARRVFIRFRGAGAHQGACVLRPSSARVDHLGSGKRLHDQVQRL